jgi:hypothetical protein
MRSRVCLFARYFCYFEPVVVLGAGAPVFTTFTARFAAISTPLLTPFAAAVQPIGLQRVRAVDEVLPKGAPGRVFKAPVRFVFDPLAAGQLQATARCRTIGIRVRERLTCCAVMASTRRLPMRTIMLGVCVAGAFLTMPGIAVSSPAVSDEAGLPNIEALGSREPDRWNGRHHYLYDEEFQPGSATVGAAPTDPRPCAGEPVRMRRSDGTSVVRRIKRCD